MIYQAMKAANSDDHLVVQKDETQRVIATCDDKQDAELVVKALNVREMVYRKMAEGYIHGVNESTTNNMNVHWQALVKLHNLDAQDEQLVWEFILQVLRENRA